MYDYWLFCLFLIKLTLIIFGHVEKYKISVCKQVKLLPLKPGVYFFYDKSDSLIYVGKAKSLRKRVASYFSKTKHESGKTALLVKKINNIRYIIVDTEYEALLLENNLIKKFQPKYNIQWRDDKTYPFICIKKEPFPRVMPVRNPSDNNSEYIGPYASARLMHVILDLCKTLYPLRTCALLLSRENIAKGKFNTCLEYQIGNCLAPCTGLQSEADYNNSISQIRKIIRGNLSEVLNHIKNEISEAAKNLKFEKAQDLKKKMELLENYRSRSIVVNQRIHNVDVFSICSYAKFAYVNYLKVMGGAIVQGHTLEVKKKLDESDEDILAGTIVEMRERFSSVSKHIFLPMQLKYDFPDITLHFPKRGDKQKLVKLSLHNAFQMMKDKQLQREKFSGKKPAIRKLSLLKDVLKLKEIPYRIECFDNSNLQGDNPVAACVVFINAKPSRREYRHFNIKTVVGSDDFASMKEVVYRRYRRQLEEKQTLPQLIIIDGGKGQLNAALESLNKLNLSKKIALIGIAKKLEKIYRVGDPHPLYIDKKSEVLHLLQQLRNEAHRFGITHHRSKRIKKILTSGLEEIRGIGPATTRELLTSFISLKRIKEASLEELKAAIGPAKAALIRSHFNKQSS